MVIWISSKLLTVFLTTWLWYFLKTFGFSDFFLYYLCGSHGLSTRSMWRTKSRDFLSWNMSSRDFRTIGEQKRREINTLMFLFSCQSKKPKLVFSVENFWQIKSVGTNQRPCLTKECLQRNREGGIFNIHTRLLFGLFGPIYCRCLCYPTIRIAFFVTRFYFSPNLTRPFSNVWYNTEDSKTGPSLTHGYVKSSLRS